MTNNSSNNPTGDRTKLQQSEPTQSMVKRLQSLVEEQQSLAEDLRREYRALRRRKVPYCRHRAAGTRGFDNGSAPPSVAINAGTAVTSSTETFNFGVTSTELPQEQLGQLAPALQTMVRLLTTRCPLQWAISTSRWTPASPSTTVFWKRVT